MGAVGAPTGMAAEGPSSAAVDLEVGVAELVEAVVSGGGGFGGFGGGDFGGGGAGGSW